MRLNRLTLGIIVTSLIVVRVSTKDPLNRGRVELLAVPSRVPFGVQVVGDSGEAVPLIPHLVNRPQQVAIAPVSRPSPTQGRSLRPLQPTLPPSILSPCPVSLASRAELAPASLERRESRLGPVADRLGLSLGHRSQNLDRQPVGMRVVA